MTFPFKQHEQQGAQSNLRIYDFFSSVTSVTTSDGKDTTKFFTPEYQLFTSQQSFSTQTPARENIEALEDAELLAISHAALQRIYDDVPKWHTLIRRVLQDVNGMTERIYMDSITITAEERYRRLLEDESEIALRAPLKHIASYLGVTPESLSRIRKKLSQA
jgi:CRP-like cAMP-binding protein